MTAGAATTFSKEALAGKDGPVGTVKVRGARSILNATQQRDASTRKGLPGAVDAGDASSLSRQGAKCPHEKASPAPGKAGTAIGAASGVDISGTRTPTSASSILRDPLAELRKLMEPIRFGNRLYWWAMTGRWAK